MAGARGLIARPCFVSGHQIAAIGDVPKAIVTPELDSFGKQPALLRTRQRLTAIAAEDVETKSLRFIPSYPSCV